MKYNERTAHEALTYSGGEEGALVCVTGILISFWLRGRRRRLVSLQLCCASPDVPLTGRRPGVRREAPPAGSPLERFFYWV